MSGRAGRHYHPCAGCGITTQASGDYCRDCGPKDDAKPCLMCGALTRADGRHCSACMRHLKEAAAHVDRPKDGLSAGGWMFDPRRRVHVWWGGESAGDRALAMPPRGAFDGGQEHDSGPGGAGTPSRGLAGSRGTRPTHV